MQRSSYSRLGQRTKQRRVASHSRTGFGDLPGVRTWAAGGHTWGWSTTVPLAAQLAVPKAEHHIRMGQGSPEKGLTSCRSFVPLLLRLWLQRDRETEGCGDVLCAVPCPPTRSQGDPHAWP